MRYTVLGRSLLILTLALGLAHCGGGGSGGGDGCCKVCSIGKPCGDTCIARGDICHVGPGCACLVVEAERDAAPPEDSDWRGNVESSDGESAGQLQLTVDGADVTGTLAFDREICGNVDPVPIAGKVDETGMLVFSESDGTVPIQSLGIATDGSFAGDMRVGTGECATIATWRAMPQTVATK